MIILLNQKKREKKLFRLVKLLLLNINKITEHTTMMVFNFQIWRLCEKIDLYSELKHMTELTNIQDFMIYTLVLS